MKETDLAMAVNNATYNDYIDRLKIMTDIAKVFYGCEPEKAAIETQFKKLDKSGKNWKSKIRKFKTKEELDKYIEIKKKDILKIVK